ncbi:hypothetical protein [Anaerostipes butyraticus]|uniref:Pycsar effector protein domain-containing protein n=1 Tax=Anaerostipes butyraticus TaxID=645466 RepID=A0A916VEF4_9FIRM|nr:hypothetical protein [Anaerostipes butyraticus]GFO85837.1 hypothetical protein ANBU17_21840 [Anaerostipes butyraticus]
MSAMQEIQYIYKDVSEWLKFAEVKHAGLFAVWTAILISLVSEKDWFNEPLVENTFLLIIAFGGSLINIISFIPFLNRSQYIKEKCYQKYCKYANNSVFYQSVFVATYSKIGIQDSVEKYIRMLEKKGVHFENIQLEEDYLKQIIEVSTVATIKIYLFNVAVKYVFGAAILYFIIVTAL